MSAPRAEYAATPWPLASLEGYMTMDSIAALAFGIIVVTSLGHTGGGIRAKVVPRVDGLPSSRGSCSPSSTWALELIGT